MPGRPRTVRRATWAALAVGAVLVAGCGQVVDSADEAVATAGAGSTAPALPAVGSVASVARTVPVDPPVAETVDGITAFAYELATTVADGDANLVLSPASIATAFGMARAGAFGMARAGAVGRTADEIDATLHLPAVGAHDALNELDRRLTEGGGVATANAAFVSGGLELEPTYVTTLGQSYGSVPVEVDFADPETKALVDRWVTEATGGRIKELFDRLPPTTLVVLANAVVLDSAWATALQVRSSAGDFTRADGTVVHPATIGAELDLRWAEVDGLVAVEVPLAEGDLAVRLLLPAPGQAPLDALAPAVVDAVDAALAPALVDLTLPRWDVSTDLALVEALGELGMVTPFGGDADFSGMAPRRMSIDQVVHRAMITVDETGVEAAAVTGITIEESAAGAAA